MEFYGLYDNMIKIHELENPDPDKKKKAEPGVAPPIPPGFNNFIKRKKNKE